MISFSGIDCGGKSTQIQLFSDYCTEKGLKTKIIHSRGGYTPLLEFMKSLIRRDKHSDELQQAQYREHIHQNAKKRKMLLWLSIFDMCLYYGVHFRIIELFGTTILADRYYWDSYIDFKIKYAEIPFDKWRVWKVLSKIYLKPDCSIIYTIPAEVSMYRSTLKDEPWPEPIELREYRISLYMDEIQNNRWSDVVDATASIEEVQQRTIGIIKL